MLELNISNLAPSQTTLNYNSMCRFGESYFGANDDGLYQLGGYTDHGVAIPALIKSGTLDLGMENKKRFRFFYFGLEANGGLRLTVHGDGALAGEYAVTINQEGIQVVRVPISRTVNAWYWEWMIENEDGAFFALHSVTALPVILHPGHA